MSPEIEVKETQLEAVTDGGVTQIKHESLEDTLWLADNIEKLVEANKKIFTVILKSSFPGDFVAFGKGEKEKVELIGAACERVARDVGISFMNRTEKVETFQDSIGPGFRYIYEADAMFRSRVIRVMSIASSRTKFFGKDSGEFKDISEVSRDDVQTAAYRGIFKEGVKALLGLRHLNRAELEKYGVKIIGSSSYNFESKSEKAEGTESVTVKIVDVKEKSGTSAKSGKPWTLYTITDAEGATYGTFSNTFGKSAKEFKASGNPATICFNKNDRGNNEITSIK